MYKVTENFSQGKVEIVADTLEDKDKLGTNYGVGSYCLVIEDSSLWMLGNDTKWHPFG